MQYFNIILSINVYSKIIQTNYVRTMTLKSLFNDPGLKEQWFFAKSNYFNSKISHDLDNVWRQGYTGKGVVVAILEGAIDFNHLDLKTNFRLDISYDFVHNSKKIVADFHTHATRMAGLISAIGNNSKCGVGAAPESQFANIVILKKKRRSVSQELLYEAFSFKNDDIHIYSNSWGTASKEDLMEGPADFTREKIVKASTYGRNGRGNIILFGSGNTREQTNNCAFNGFTQIENIFTISSLTANGEIPYYVQPCTAIVAAALSNTHSESEDYLYTTGANNSCFRQSGFVSASTAIAAGIFALLLQANKDLTVRQILYLIAKTSTQYDKSAMINAAGYLYSKYIGFGLLNATALIQTSRDESIANYPQQHVCTTTLSSEFNHDQNSVFYESYIYSSGCYNFKNCVTTVEEVLLNFSLIVDRRNHVSIFMTSPSGTRVKVLEPRPNDSSNEGFDFWVVKTLAFYKEKAAGFWRIETYNLYEDSKLMNWRLTILGSCTNYRTNIILHNKVKRHMCRNKMLIGVYLSMKLCFPTYLHQYILADDIFSFSKSHYSEIKELAKIIDDL